jgi:hypothetical protein
MLGYFFLVIGQGTIEVQDKDFILHIGLSVNFASKIRQYQGFSLHLLKIKWYFYGIDITDNHIFSSTSQPLYGTIEEQPKANRAIGKTFSPRNERKPRRDEPEYARTPHGIESSTQSFHPTDANDPSS